MSSSSTFWESIRHLSGWGWALGEIRRNERMLDQTGPNWSESPLHWAMLGHLEATSLVCQLRSDHLGLIDSQGRSPLDWAMEKIFFLRQRQQGELPSERRRNDAMIEPARLCALFGLEWVVAHNITFAWSGDQARFVRVALSAGEFELATAADGLLAQPSDSAIWLSGLAGMWPDEACVKRFVASLSSRHSLAGDTEIFGRPLGLHVAHLWATGAIDAQRAAWFHGAGLRLDQETHEESIEIFCAGDGVAGAVRLEALGRLVGW